MLAFRTGLAAAEAADEHHRAAAGEEDDGFVHLAVPILDDSVQPPFVAVPFHPPDGAILDRAVAGHVRGHGDGVLDRAEVDLVERDAPHG